MMAGGSIGVALIGALIYLLSGGRIDPSAIEGLTELVPAQQVEFTAEEQELASFSKKILAGTEDVWSAYFEQNGLGTYEAPSMVLYTGATSSGCGTGRSSRLCISAAVLHPAAPCLPPGSRTSQDFPVKELPHLRQTILILPWPRGTRRVVLQEGQVKNL